MQYLNNQNFEKNILNLRASVLFKLLQKNNIRSNYNEVYYVIKSNKDESTYKYFLKREKRIYYYLLYFLLFLFILVGSIALSYYYKDYVIIFFDRMEINTFYLIKLFNFIENSILYISETYNLLIFKLKSLTIPRDLW
jgi:hypothetical protein